MTNYNIKKYCVKKINNYQKNEEKITTFKNKFKQRKYPHHY